MPPTFIYLFIIYFLYFAGHTSTKEWVDMKVQSRPQAFLDGLTTSLKGPTGKGRRLIIGHISGEEGFVEESLLIFEAKKGTDDYHKEMNAECFEEWFGRILPNLKPNSAVVIDNAPYHSQKIELLPTISRVKKKNTGVGDKQEH